MARWLGLCFRRHHYMQNDVAERTAEAKMYGQTSVAAGIEGS